MEGLPLDGALARSIDPERTGVGWGRQEDLMALIAELIDHGNRQLFAFNVKKGTKIPDPIFIQRPHLNRARSKDPKDVARVFNNLGVRVVKETNDSED